MFVKVCQITNEEDALLAVAMGADAVGFIFAPSPRQVQPTVVRDIVKRLPPEILTVGVFQNEAPSRVIEIVQATGLRGAQLHGHESPEETRRVKERVPVVFKVFGAGDPAVRRAAEHRADAVLVDNPRGGGSGQVFDWSLAEGVPGGQRLILSGGLTAENVTDAITTVHPWGIDVGTGVEASPGHKDATKVRRFIQAVRAAEVLEKEPDPTGPAPFDWMEHE